jgi:glycosyltransferase involved in cell wall biosynthesis
MRVIYLVKRWHMHTASGGYDRLATEAGGIEIRRKELKGFLSRICRKAWRTLTPSKPYLIDYRFEDWLVERRLLLKCFVNPPDAVHVLYGDDQLDFLLRWRKLLRCSLIVTFHLPADQLTQRFEHFQANEIHGIDTVIVLSTAEIPRFQRWFGENKVAFVPHGIDTSKFLPANLNSDCTRLRLLFVGEHMRDWNVFHRVIDEVDRNCLDVHFDIVTRDDLFRHFTGCSNISLYSRIPESHLVELYQRADALFLPLTNATANNAVLEALACGVPIISTDVGGMPDYVSTDCGWLLPKGDVHSAVELIKELCLDKEIARSRRQNARAQALKFDWKQIVDRLSIVYSEAQCRR